MDRQSLRRAHGLEPDPSSAVAGCVASSNSPNTLRLSVWVDEPGIKTRPSQATGQTEHGVSKGPDIHCISA